MAVKRPRLLIVGAGRVGTCLARLLSSLGCDVRLWARSRLSDAAKLALTRSRFKGSVTEGGAPPVDKTLFLVILAVPDSQIAHAARLVANGYMASSTPVVHCSGAARVELTTAGPRRFPFGSLHPAFCFSGPDVPLDLLRKICFLVEGEPAVKISCSTLLTSLGLQFVEAQDTNRSLYHAGCSTAGNFLSLLGTASLEMLRCAGIDEHGARQLIQSLMVSALANGLRMGFGESATGPAVRRDSETIEAQTDAVANSCPHLLPFFVEATARLRESGALPQPVDS